MQTNNTFRINKQTKRRMSAFLDPHKRGEFKRAMIQAQLASAVVVKVEKK